MSLWRRLPAKAWVTLPFPPSPMIDGCAALPRYCWYGALSTYACNSSWKSEPLIDVPFTVAASGAIDEQADKPPTLSVSASAPAPRRKTRFTRANVLAGSRPAPAGTRPGIQLDLGFGVGG